jgi:hypothetical protein
MLGITFYSLGVNVITFLCQLIIFGDVSLYRQRSVPGSSRTARK